MSGRKKRYTDSSAEESSLDAAFETRLEVAQRKYPNNVYTGGEESARCICLPVPALAPRILLQQEGWPLGRFYLLDAPQESFKSSLGYEIIRWHRKLGGKGKIIEVEDKKSPDLCLSINEYDPKASSTHFCDTMQDWNAALTYWIHDFIKIMDGDPKAPKSRPGLGRLFPICFLVDSIMAAVGEAIMEGIEKDGHGKQHWASDTGLLSEFLKVFTKWLPEYPFTVIGINHLKPGATPQGIPVRHMPGGKAPGYHATVDIELRKLKEEKRANDTYARLRLKTQKNSSAPKDEILVDIVWYIDVDHPTEAGECLQRTYFDWESASIGCLFEAMTAERSGSEIAERVRNLVELHTGDERRRLVWSPVLEITKDDPLNWREAGFKLEQKLQTDKEFRDKLYPLLGVRRRHLFQPRVDYRDQQEEARTVANQLQQARESVARCNPLRGPGAWGEAEEGSPLDVM